MDIRVQRLAASLRRRCWSWLAALAVAASALGAVLLYRYVDVGALGPLPDMYENTWQVPGKLLSAYAEAAAIGLARTGPAHPPQSRTEQLPPGAGIGRKRG